MYVAGLSQDEIKKIPPEQGLVRPQLQIADDNVAIVWGAPPGVAEYSIYLPKKWALLGVGVLAVGAAYGAKSLWNKRKNKR